MHPSARWSVSNVVRLTLRASCGALGCAVIGLGGAAVAGADPLTAATTPPSAADTSALVAANMPGAGTSGAPQLQEVVVTAQKRTESLQNVPLSIVALGSQQLQREGITGVADLMSGQVPALRIEPFAGNPSVLEVAIRGFVDSNGVNVTDENPVPIYIDDVYYGRQTAMAMQLTEIERIEVLRGPQGTLFGRNAEGGAVRIVSAEPTGTFGIREKLEAGNFGYWNTTTHIDLPSVANVATKLDILSTNNRGWQTNSAPGQNNFGRLGATGVQFTALWKPAEGFSLEYAYDWMQLKSTEVFNQQIATNDLYQHLAPGFTQTVWPSQTTVVTSVPHPVFRPLDDQKFTGHRLTGTWALATNITLKSITTYRDDVSPLWNTADASAALPGAFIRSTYPYITGTSVLYNIRHNQFSQEFQLGGRTGEFNWVTGLFYFNEHGSQLDTTYFGTAFPNAITSGPPGFLPVALGNAIALSSPIQVPGSPTGASIHNRSYAAYGQATWRPAAFASKFAYTVGVRVGRDEKESTRPVGGIWANVTYPVPPSTAVPAATYDCSAVPRPAQCTSTSAQTRFLPMASLAYDWTPDLNTYFRYSTGYQAAVVGLASQTFRPAKPSTVNSYEVGLKSEFLQHRARANIAAFYLNWFNPQENVQTVSSSTVEYFNGPTVHSSGIEFDSSFLPIDRLTINVSVDYQRASKAPSVNPYPDPYTANGSTVLYDRIPELPKWAGSASLMWDLLRTSYGTWNLNLDAESTSDYYTVPQISTPVPGHTLLNGRFGLASIQVGTGVLDVSLWGRNLTNKSYETFRYNVPAVVPLNPNQPAIGTAAAFGEVRTYGITVNLTF